MYGVKACRFSCSSRQQGLLWSPRESSDVRSLGVYYTDGLEPSIRVCVLRFVHALVLFGSWVAVQITQVLVTIKWYNSSLVHDKRFLETLILENRSKIMAMRDNHDELGIGTTLSLDAVGWWYCH